MKTALLILSFIQTGFILFLVKDFSEHYSYVNQMSDVRAKEMYILGCLDNSNKTYQNCQDLEKEYDIIVGGEE